MIDHLLVGEVVAGFPPSHVENRNKLRWEYTVKSVVANGTQQVFPFCIAVEAFGGVLNYCQQVIPCTGEATKQAYSSIDSPGVRKAGIGARCVLAFPMGDTRQPLILGFVPHESSPVEIDMPVQPKGSETQLRKDKVYPNILYRYNGMELAVNEIGELSITHYGFPKIDAEYQKKLSIESPNPNYITRMQFLEKGEWKVFDAFGQFFNIDPELGIIQIGNGENELLFSQKEKFASLVVSGKFEEVIGADRYRYVGGIETQELKKDQNILIEGNFKREIKGKLEEKITQDAKYTFENKLSLTAKDTTIEFAKLKLTAKDTTINLDKLTLVSTGDISLEAGGGAKLKMSSGKVAFGTSAAELVDQVIKAIDALLPANQSALCMTGTGPSGPLLPPAAATLATIKAALSGIKGSL